jgi:hypothetical protein
MLPVGIRRCISGAKQKGTFLDKILFSFDPSSYSNMTVIMRTSIRSRYTDWELPRQMSSETWEHWPLSSVGITAPSNVSVMKIVTIFELCHDLLASRESPNVWVAVMQCSWTWSVLCLTGFTLLRKTIAISNMSGTGSVSPGKGGRHRKQSLSRAVIVFQRPTMRSWIPEGHHKAPISRIGVHMLLCIEPYPI